MASLSAPEMSDLTDQIEARAVATCAADGLSARSYYEASLTQCMFLAGSRGEELRMRVKQQLQDFSGKEAQILARNVVAFRLSLDDVLPSTVHQPEGAKAECNPKGLPLEKIKAEKHWDSWSSDEELDTSFNCTGLDSSKRVRLADAPVNNAASSAGVSATDNLDSSKRVRLADVPVSNAASSAGVSAIDKKCNYARAGAESMPDTATMPVVETMPVVVQSCSSGDEASLCEKWLRDVSPLLSSYDGKLLRRYVPSLPTASLQEVVTVSRTEHSAYMASRKEQIQQLGVKEQISNMAMRRVLATTFARLAPTDAHIQELHRQWEATKDKPNRKSKASAQQSTMQWHQRWQNRSG